MKDACRPKPASVTMNVHRRLMCMSQTASACCRTASKHPFAHQSGAYRLAEPVRPGKLMNGWCACLEIARKTQDAAVEKRCISGTCWPCGLTWQHSWRRHQVLVRSPKNQPCYAPACWGRPHVMLTVRNLAIAPSSVLGGVPSAGHPHVACRHDPGCCKAARAHHS